MSRSAKPQNGRRRFLRDVVRTAGGLAAVGVALGLQQQTARASGVRLRPPGAMNENAFASACVRCGQCVQACPLRHLKTGDAGFWPVGGHAIFCSRDIPCEMCEDIPCAKVSRAVRWIVRSDRSTTRGWGWRYWWTRKTVSTFRGCAAMFVIANARKLMRQSPWSWSATRVPVSTPAFCRRFTATPVPAAVSAKKCACWNNRQSRCYRCHWRGELGHHYRFGWLEGNNGKS